MKGVYLVLTTFVTLLLIINVKSEADKVDKAND